MLLIPLRGTGTRGDQIENARYFQEAGAAQVLSSPGKDELVLAVKTFAMDEEKRKIIAGASARIGEKDGAGIIANALMEKANDICRY
jgi:UDP-N-acetylglucosamine--N-acetylmuramyl-(pentapeptide) pyrophosphoryl-undecaprenol N-acetylglucosamine transferase